MFKVGSKLSHLLSNLLNTLSIIWNLTSNKGKIICYICICKYIESLFHLNVWRNDIVHHQREPMMGVAEDTPASNQVSIFKRNLFIQ